jgi:hypothetical protein
MVGVLATGHKVRRFKPGRGRRNLRAIKIRNTSSYGVEVKPPDPRFEILRHVKHTSKYEQRYFVWPNSCPSPVLPVLLIYDYVGRINRGLY